MPWSTMLACCTVIPLLWRPRWQCRLIWCWVSNWHIVGIVLRRLAVFHLILALFTSTQSVHGFKCIHNIPWTPTSHNRWYPLTVIILHTFVAKSQIFKTKTKVSRTTTVHTRVGQKVLSLTYVQKRSWWAYIYFST